MRLDSYTKMTHRVEEETSKPVAFITKFSVIGYKAIPDLDTINDPLTCKISAVGFVGNVGAMSVDMSSHHSLLPCFGQ